MHSRSLDHWTHEHVFLAVGHARNERRSWLVVGLTGTMISELFCSFLNPSTEGFFSGCVRR